MCWPVYFALQMPFVRGWLARHNIPGLPSYSNTTPPTTNPEGGILTIAIVIYTLARIGNLILMFISLRAVPTGSYISIEWLASIPHI
jgi:hypothetical protein